MMIPHWFSSGLFVINVLIIVYLVPRIIVQRRESAATLAWVLFIVLVPAAGALLFYLLGTRRMRRRRRQRAATHERLGPGLAQVDALLRAFRFGTGRDRIRQDHEAPYYSLAARVFPVERSRVTTGNHVEVLFDGEAAFASIENSIRQAQSYIHVEFYIFRPDRTGKHILSLLEERARAGVEVRLLVDAVGSFELKKLDVANLIAAGGHVAEFLPVSPITKPFSVNFRNHRKIVVIDGRVAFTGGINVGDEYRGGYQKRMVWRDTHVLVRGPAALRLQQIFADDWHFSTNEECVSTKYFPPPEPAGPVAVQVVASGPDATADRIHRSIFTAITSAEQRVWLTTPYFIPDRAILVSLQTAAMRGVDVRLLLPGKSDSRLVLYAGRSQYDELLAAGVRIFEYQKGMLHSKTMVVDEAWTTIGSANMDMRSFVLNWEANIMICDPQVTRTMAMLFLLDLESTIEIKKPVHRSPWQRFAEAGSYVLSPLLLSLMGLL